MFVFSVWFILFHAVTRHKAFSFHSFSFTHHTFFDKVLYCFTSQAIYGTRAQNSMLGNLLCAVVTMFRIARFSHTVSAIQSMYAVHAYYANVCVEYLDGMQHLPKCAVFDHSTHNALCLTFFFQRDKWMGSNIRCIWIIFINIKIYIYS